MARRHTICRWRGCCAPRRAGDMLHLIPAPLHRVLCGWRIARGGCWWRWRRADSRLFDDRPRCGRPGAAGAPFLWHRALGLSRRRAGAGRGALERRNARICRGAGLRPDRADPAGAIEEPLHGAREPSHLFTGQVAGEPVPDMREVVEARFFALDALPDAARWAVRAARCAAVRCYSRRLSCATSARGAASSASRRGSQRQPHQPDRQAQRQSLRPAAHGQARQSLPAMPPAAAELRERVAMRKIVVGAASASPCGPAPPACGDPVPHDAR